jgi:hypothetical protein
VCCNTDDTANDYGFYDINFEARFVEYQNHVLTPLKISIEILPDCKKSVIKLKPATIQPFFLRANVGKTNQTLSLSNSLTHDFEGHYSDYCGYP